MEVDDRNKDTIFMDMVMSTFNKIETLLTLPDELLQLSMITMSEYNRKYNPEVYNQYLVYALPIVEQMREHINNNKEDDTNE